jgi:hypothetical protein
MPQHFCLRVTSATFLVLACAAASLAQVPPPPTTYSLTEINGMYGLQETAQVFRDGSRAVIELTMPTVAGSKAIHTRAYYDLTTHVSYDVDLGTPSAGCFESNFSGDWGDPFAMSAQIEAQLSQRNVKAIGTEAVNGFATTIGEIPGSAPGQAMRVWADDKTGLIIKLVNGQALLLEVKQFSTSKPSASIFAVPATCVQPLGGPAPVPPPNRITTDTGGISSDYIDATMPPASANSCSVNFKIVHAGTLKPITSGFHVSTDLDLGANQNSPGAASQAATLPNGALKDVSAQLHSGALRIPNAPDHFNLDVEFGQGGSATALVYRQCPQPQSMLLLVLKNPAKVSDGADWLWSKTRE